MKLTLAIITALCAGQVSAQEAGECMSLSEADVEKNAKGHTIVAQQPGPSGSVLVLVDRGDGSFKEVLVFAGTACHVKDFVSDPRKASFNL